MNEDAKKNSFFEKLGQFAVDINQDQAKKERFDKIIEAINTLGSLTESEFQEMLEAVKDKLPSDHEISDTFIALLQYALQADGNTAPINQEAIECLRKTGGVLFPEKISELAISNSKLDNFIFGFSEKGRAFDWSKTERIENGEVTVSSPTKKNGKGYVVIFDLDYSGVKGFSSRPLGPNEQLVLVAAFSEFLKFFNEHGYMPSSINTTSKRMMRTLAGNHVRSQEFEEMIIKGAETLACVRIKIDMTEHARMKGKQVTKDVITDYMLPIRIREQEKIGGKNVTYYEIGMSPILQYSFDVGNYYRVPAAMLQLPEVGNKKYSKEYTMIANALIRNLYMENRNPKILFSTLAAQSEQPYNETDTSANAKMQRKRFRERVIDIVQDWIDNPAISVTGYNLKKKGRQYNAITIDFQRE